MDGDLNRTATLELLLLERLESRLVSALQAVPEDYAAANEDERSGVRRGLAVALVELRALRGEP